MRCMRRIERVLVFVIAALVVLVAPTAVPLFAQEAWADEAAAALADDSPRDDSSLGTAKSLSVDCSAAMVDGYALIGPGGTLTYTMVVTAAGDAGEVFENVCVMGDFIDDSERKVDLSSMALASATVGGADIRARVSPLSAAPNTVKGWNIGSLQAGETVSIVLTCVSMWTASPTRSARRSGRRPQRTRGRRERSVLPPARQPRAWQPCRTTAR